MADGLYASFAEVLSVCQSFKDDLAVILDPESGFAPRMRELCEQQCVESGQVVLYIFIDNRLRLEDLEDGAEGRSLADEIDLLRLEANTWGLLQAILPYGLSIFPYTRLEAHSGQGSKNRNATFSNSQRSTARKPVHANVHTCPSNHPCLTSSHRTYCCTRVVT